MTEDTIVPLPPLPPLPQLLLVLQTSVRCSPPSRFFFPLFLSFSSPFLSFLIAHAFSFLIIVLTVLFRERNTSEKYLATRDQTSDLINKFVSLCLNIRIANFRKQHAPLQQLLTFLSRFLWRSLPVNSAFPYLSLLSCYISCCKF